MYLSRDSGDGYGGGRPCAENGYGGHKDFSKPDQYGPISRDPYLRYN